MMTKNLSKTGNSLALVLDKELLRATRITGKTRLNVITDGDSIVISPVRDKKRQAKLAKLVDEMHGTYGEVFSRLAK